MDYSQGVQELQKTQEEETIFGIKTYKVFWTVFFCILFIIILLIVYLIFAGSPKTVSDKKLIKGVALEVGENDVVKFKVGEEQHGMRINLVSPDSVDLTISSEPINLSLNINEIKEVDLDNDGVFDIKIKLVSIVNGKAIIAFQRIEKESCQENWECSGWSDCSRGIQKRDCNDLNSCGTIFDKPSEKKDCLEVEFIENSSAFENETNKNMNNSLNITTYKNITNVTTAINISNKTIVSNWTNKTNIENLTNKTNTTTIINNSIVNSNISNNTNIIIKDNHTLTNTTNSTVCPQNTHICYEYYGFFCSVNSDSSSLNPSCCPKECLKFNSTEQFCSSRGYLYFTGNETHICKVQIYFPFNRTNIPCCASIDFRVNLNTTGLSL